MDKKTYKSKDIPSFINKIITIRWPFTNSVYIGIVRNENEEIIIKYPIIIEPTKTINLTFISRKILQPTSNGIVVRLPDEEEYKLYKRILNAQITYNKWTKRYINQKTYHHSSTR